MIFFKLHISVLICDKVQTPKSMIKSALKSWLRRISYGGGGLPVPENMVSVLQQEPSITLANLVRECLVGFE